MQNKNIVIDLTKIFNILQSVCVCVWEAYDTLIENGMALKNIEHNSLF